MNLRFNVCCTWALPLALVLAGCGPMGSGDVGLEIGAQRPPLEAASWLNGPAPGSDDLNGKVLVVDCWASW